FQPENVRGRVFTLTNNCPYTVWPGILTGAGGPSLEGGGFTLATGESQSLNPPDNWSGRLWPRTGCTFEALEGPATCSTGDCGGLLQCSQVGGVPPVTLTEFTLADDVDFYDVSLVDGYNVPLSIETLGGRGDCRAAGCWSDLTDTCPPELAVNENGRVVACKSACEAFGSPEYCCTGEFGSPQTCGPSAYSQTFKTACPAAYSYAYDDATSTFTCTQADYQITFCS
ncbi:pathogenesis-related thaumatin-like protein 3.5, partial [Cryptomeria japonica]|uniref:pathogenesis-related thaumatin-like protein 3.5 n=1 Tax=Cryptomeria japonica TaxID=3369 RepID=UPI0025ABF150